MSIKRMLLAASMALAASAFAVPAVAQATVTLTDPAGTALKAGADVTATSADLQTHTEVGNVYCAKVILHTEVEVNDGNHVVLVPKPGEEEGTIEGKCHLTTGEITLPATVQDITLGTLTFDTWGNGSATLTSIVRVFLDEEHQMETANCHLQGSVAFKAIGGDQVKVPGSILKPTPADECPAPQGEITGSFKLETSGGQSVTLDYKATS